MCLPGLFFSLHFFIQLLALSDSCSLVWSGLTGLVTVYFLQCWQAFTGPRKENKTLLSWTFSKQTNPLSVHLQHPPCNNSCLSCCMDLVLACDYQCAPLPREPALHHLPPSLDAIFLNYIHFHCFGDDTQIYFHTLITPTTFFPSSSALFSLFIMLSHSLQETTYFSFRAFRDNAQSTQTSWPA